MRRRIIYVNLANSPQSVNLNDEKVASISNSPILIDFHHADWSCHGGDFGPHRYRNGSFLDTLLRHPAKLPAGPRLQGGLKAKNLDTEQFGLNLYILSV